MKAALKKVPTDLVEEFDYEQGSPDWHAAHIGVPTAGKFGDILADSDERRMRTKLLHRMAAEVIFGRRVETFSNAAMAHGLEIEPHALNDYGFTRGVTVRRVGFVKRTVTRPLLRDSFVVGCSPDGMIGNDGLVECKRMQPDLIVALMDSGRIPSEHKAQCHGQMWVTGRKWCDLKIYYAEIVEGEVHRFPLSPVFHLERNEAEVARIQQAVEVFDHDLKQLVKRMNARRA